MWIGGGVSEMLDDVVGEVNGAAASIYLTAIPPRCSGKVDDVVGYWWILGKKSIVLDSEGVWEASE
jgi:hypothetical protein